MQNCNFDNEFQSILENEINQKISANEILTAIKSLRNNKSPGIDNIVNEHLKTIANIMLPIYVKLFNIIFDTGIIPECWTLGTIKPIYKNKGNIREPGNYRPITLLSCFGKVFTAIINNRLNNFSDKYGLIHWEQAGFRKNFSTTDKNFILKSLIDIVQSQKKNFTVASLTSNRHLTLSGEPVFGANLLKLVLWGNVLTSFSTCIEISNQKWSPMRVVAATLNATSEFVRMRIYTLFFLAYI